jgi:glycosyltransferase involved in cell wall biosynthesis
VSEPGTSGGTPESPALAHRLDAIQAELTQLRTLLTKVYEDTPRATAELLAARRSAEYASAYSASPLISVRIGAYGDGEVLLGRAIASVRRQTYDNWEAIVVCDGRDSRTAERISSLGDPRIHCGERPRNGPYPAQPHARWLVAGTHPFNEAFAQARGAWIAPIDQDDEWSHDHLEVLLATAQSSRAEVVYGVARVVVGSHGETYFGAWPPALGDFGFQTALQHASLTSFLYDVNSHLFDEPADWQLARRMLEAGVRFEFLDRILTTYFVEDDSPSLQWWRERVRQRGAHVE